MATSPQSPPKRPRLSLQIKAIANGSSGRTSRCVAAAVDVKSPTAFNTLSNVYATAVERSTPQHETPPTAILGRRPVLRLQTHDALPAAQSTHTPYLGPYLETPVTAQPLSPAVIKHIAFPSAAMTATPPLSAQPPEQNGAQVFTFDTATTLATAIPPGTKNPVPAVVQQPRRRTAMPVGGKELPYTHPRSLRSILRNSPLPPLSTISPESPRRQSLRLQEKAARRVAYNSPLTQEITTWRYTRSHIDLLSEDATPISPSIASEDDGDNLLDQAMADAASCDTTRDGGQTPGPFEEMRRRMANMHASTPMTLSPTGGGIRKRGGKRREKKRRWVWTIGQDEEAEEAAADTTTPATAIFEPAASTTPTKKEIPASVPVLGMPAPRPRTRNQQAQLAKAVAAAAAAAAATTTQQTTQVPLLGLPTPPTRPAAASQPPAPQPHPEMEQDRHARELTPIPSSLLPTRHSTPDSCSSSVRHLSPEPTTATLPTALSMSMFRHMGGGMGMRMSSMLMDMNMGASVDAEPPTPSVESNCSRDSVFETSRVGGGGRGGVGGDVEMSDASSFTSDDGERDGVVGKEEGVVGEKYHGGGFGGEDGDVEMDEGTPTMTARPVEGRGRGWVPWGNNGS